MIGLPWDFFFFGVIITYGESQFIRIHVCGSRFGSNRGGTERNGLGDSAMVWVLRPVGNAAETRAPVGSEADSDCGAGGKQSELMLLLSSLPFVQALAGCICNSISSCTDPNSIPSASWKLKEGSEDGRRTQHIVPFSAGPTRLLKDALGVAAERVRRLNEGAGGRALRSVLDSRGIP